ncbi:MAG: hypothetical protein VX549_09775 [Pseudomonadota bacterium]|nr:hypothetical protein [Pseudomonadota bacterium]
MNTTSHERLLPLVLVSALLAACGQTDFAATPQDGQPGATADCLGEVPVDYRSQSLPMDLVPRPGPAALYMDPPRAPQLENTGEWQAPPILVSGTEAYRCGEYIYQDWLFDDHGALGILDPNDPKGSTSYLFSPKAGTLTYPTDPAYANNAADLVEFRVKPIQGATLFRITLNTLIDPMLTAVTVALGDSDEPVNWPHSAGVSSPAAYFVTVAAGQAQLLLADGTPIAPAPELRIDLERRQLEIRIDESSWQPGDSEQRIAIGVGLWDREANQYLQPSLQATSTTPGGASPLGAALFNMGFRFDEPMPAFATGEGRTIADAAALARVQARFWREKLQADTLATGDVSPLHARVDFAKLRAGLRDDSGIPTTGPINRIFASRYSFGQGADYDRACGGVSAARPCDGVMVGQLQPYALYVPEQPEPAPGYGLTLMLHALSANYNQYLDTRHASQFGERGDGHLVVTPAGRGPDGFYFDVAEADTFEVWADVARHYRLNPNQVALGGISMGGIGTYRLAPRYPDLFGYLYPVVAGPGSAEPRLASLRNVPVTMWAALLDELQPVTTTEAAVTTLGDLGYRFDAYLFQTWDHLTPSTYDYYQPMADAVGHAEVHRDPHHITYVLAPQEDEPRVDAIADHAYWLSGLSLREASLETGTIDAYSEGFGLAEPVAESLSPSAGLLTGGHHEPAPYLRRQLVWAEPESVDVANRLRITARNIATVTIHPERARISCDADIVVDSDGPIEVHLAGCDNSSNPMG